MTELGHRTFGALPTRPIFRPEIQTGVSLKISEAWATEVGPVLGRLIPSETDRVEVLRLLHTYRHLNQKMRRGIQTLSE